MGFRDLTLLNAQFQKLRISAKPRFPSGAPLDRRNAQSICHLDKREKSMISGAPL
jgi:hypothetical protein